MHLERLGLFIGGACFVNNAVAVGITPPSAAEVSSLLEAAASNDSSRSYEFSVLANDTSSWYSPLLQAIPSILQGLLDPEALSYGGSPPFYPTRSCHPQHVSINRLISGQLKHLVKGHGLKRTTVLEASWRK